MFDFGFAMLGGVVGVFMLGWELGRFHEAWLAWSFVLLGGVCEGCFTFHEQRYFAFHGQ